MLSIVKLWRLDIGDLDNKSQAIAWQLLAINLFKNKKIFIACVS